MKIKSLFLMLAVFPLVVTAQTSDLKESLKTLKKNFEKHAVASPYVSDRTRFKSDKFNSCVIKFYFLNTDAVTETFVEFAPILSSTGTINRSTSSTQNDVYIKNPDGTLQRNERLKRTNEIEKDPNNPSAEAFKSDEVNFSSIIADSIVLNAETAKNMYSLVFSTNDVTKEYRIDGNHKIYLNTKQSQADEILKNFKTVVQGCRG
jgi:hypothetical protein